ncbi:uncharacterized protein LOC125667016 [Ostrea edulis]|uniref:uncharacterized protein LOC125667016 n=1 Tax=Ostrea edulis TaxID=37623 RepID=UPI002094FC18|nr:uncharacterized protein LOC125667016 [Ostrea edulis]
MRPVLDLSFLNQYLVIPHFKMETNRSIRTSLHTGMWTSSLDLTDAYFHVPIAPAYRKFLRLVWEGKVYAFRAMPFGLSTAPLVFTKNFQTVVAYLHSQSIFIHTYLDDSLIKNFSFNLLHQHTHRVIHLLLKLGFLISWEKSEIVPSQSFIFIGEQFRTDLGIVLPPEEKFLKLQYLLDELLSVKQASARQFLQLIGFLISLMDIVPLGRLHIRPIQWYLLEFWVPASQQWEAVIPILPRLYPHLLWWSVRENVMIGCSLDPPVPSMTLFTDASLTGWGATLEGREASGIWSGLQLTEHINLLEMRAVLLALKHFSQFVQGQSLMIATDNTTVVAYLQNQGGTHSQSLYLLCKEIMLFCRSLGIRLSVRHVPGNLNLVADALSRSLHPVNTEWELHPAVFQEICLKWDRPHIDLFATHLNCKLPTFVSPIPDNKALAVDAMSFDWKGMFSYMFPPFRLLPKILHKIRVEICKTILIAPAWPKQSWFPDLLQLCCARPILLPLRKDLLSQFKGRKVHQNLSNLHLHAWLLSGNLSDRMAFLTEQPNVSLVQSENLQEQFMTLSGTSSVLGVVQRKLILSQLLSNS